MTWPKLLILKRLLLYQYFSQSQGVIRYPSSEGVERKLQDIWSVYREATVGFAALTATLQSQAIDEHLLILESIVVLLYDCASNKQEVIAAQQQLFIQKARQKDCTPLTKIVLVEHLKRAAYITGYC